MISLRALEDDVRGGITGIRLAVRYCEKECPKAFHSIEVRQTIQHNVSRIERALKVYVQAEKSRSSEP